MDKNIVLLIKDFEGEKNYWLEKLAGEMMEVELIPDPSHGPGYQSQSHGFQFNDPLTQQIGYTSKDNDLSLYIILLAAFKVLLFWYTSQKDIIVSSPMHEKDEADFNDFVILRDFIDEKMCFLDVLMAVKSTVVDAYQNQHYPIDNILEELGFKDSKDRFNRIIFLFDTLHKKEKIQPIIESVANDMALSFNRTKDGFEGKIRYNGNRFNPGTITRLLDYYERVLTWVLANMKVTLQQMELLSDAEKQRLLKDLNHTAAPYPAQHTLHQLFAMQATRTPDNIAVVGERASDRELPLQKITYRQLDEESDRLAHQLQAKGSGPHSIVAIMLRPAIETIVGILGILKTGAAYLPIEANYPVERIRYMLADSGARILVQDNPDLYLQEGENPPIVLNVSQMDLNSTSATPYLAPHGTPDDLAYVIYTSGTTGKPKGVLVGHRGIVNYANWRMQTYGITATDVALQLLSYAFDGFNSNLYSSLIAGGALIIVPGEKVLDFSYIKQIIRQWSVTNISLIPRVYEMLLDSAEADELKSVRFVVLAGEKPGQQVVQKSRAQNPAQQLIMEYGPTEASVTATANMVLHTTNTTVIGRPISNVQVFILGPTQRLQPEGMAGEILITGISLASGYLNGPQLTAEKFITPSIPFTQEETRFYRTGDMGRWLPDGQVELLGRMDNQVKVRGFRIELEEIERSLCQFEGITSAAVILLKEKEETNTCAYFVADKQIEISEFRDYLSKVIPYYMIPAYFVQLEQLPLTSSGKLNRAALTSMELKMNSENEFVAPQNEKEKLIAEIWKDVLRVEHVGIYDNFFNIGGNSLNIVILNRKLNAALGMDIPTAVFFEHITIHAFVEYLSQREAGTSHSSTQVDRTESIEDVRKSRERRKERRR